MYRPVSGTRVGRSIQTAALDLVHGGSLHARIPDRPKMTVSNKYVLSTVRHRRCRDLPAGGDAARSPRNRIASASARSLSPTSVSQSLCIRRILALPHPSSSALLTSHDLPGALLFNHCLGVHQRCSNSQLRVLRRCYMLRAERHRYTLT